MLRDLKNAPLPVAICVLGYLGPQELSLFLGGIRLPVHRLVLLVMICVAGYVYLSKRPIRFHIFDYAFLGFNLWTVLAYVVHMGSGDGIEYGGSLALESFASYMVARMFIRDEKSFRGALAFIFLAVLIAGAVALPEALSGRHFVHETLHRLTGYYHPVGYEERLGLTRAYSFFDHPIHLGTFCASIFALIWYSERRRVSRFVKSGLVVGATFLGLSSAPLLCLALQGGLVGWDRITRGIKSRALLTLLAVVVGYAVVSLLATRNPFHILATGLTLDPWTGYYRVMIWTHGLDSVGNNLLLGIGLNDWARPAWMYSSTVDAFWLVIAMTTGLPALFLLLTAILNMMWNVHRPRFKPLDMRTRNLRLAWTFAVIALALAGCTVHYWNAIYAYFFFVCGMAGWMADGYLIKRAATLMQRQNASMPADPPIPGNRGRRRGGNHPPHRPMPRPVYAFPRQYS